MTRSGIHASRPVSVLAKLAVCLVVLTGASSAVSAHSRLAISNIGVSEGQTLSGSVSWAALVSRGAPNRVVFSIDGVSRWKESVSPFVFDGDGNQLDTTTLANGTHTFKVTAYPTSGRIGSVNSQVTATVSNSVAPVPLSPPVSVTSVAITGVPAVGHSLTATPGAWSSAAAISYTYQWMLCDSAGSNCGASASGTVFPVTADAAGHTVRVSVTASNPAGSTTSSSNATTVITIPPSGPSLISAPTVSGIAGVGHELTTTSGSWSGSTPFAYSFQWQRCNTSGGACEAVSGATSSSYVLASDDAGHTMVVSVTATNSLASAAAQSDSTVVVTPAPAQTPTGTSPTTTTPKATTTTPKTTTTPPAAATATPASAPALSGVWRWDAATAKLDPSSASKVAAFQSYAVGAGTYFEAAVAWVNAPAGTASYSIPVTGQTVKQITAPIPLGTKPGDSNDHSLVVYGADGTDYDFGLAQYDSGTSKITSTDGAAIVSPGAAFETGPGSANAARFPLGAGPITPSDIKSGAINHALVFSMPNVGPAPNPYPANTPVGYPSNTGLPLGTWLRLDPSVNVAALGLPSFETQIAIALQKYGMFVRDIGSTFCIIGTDQVNQGGNAVDWPAVGVTLPLSTPSGVPYARGLSAKFPWNDLQVLQPATP